MEAPEEEKIDEGWERTARINENAEQFAKYLEKLAENHKEQQYMMHRDLTQEERDYHESKMAKAENDALHVMDNLLANAERYANGDKLLIELGMEFEVLKELPDDQQRERLERKANADWGHADSEFQKMSGDDIMEVQGFWAAKTAIQYSYIKQLEEGLASDHGKAWYATYVKEMEKAATDMEGAIKEEDGLVHRHDYTGMTFETPTTENFGKLLEDANECMEKPQPRRHGRKGSRCHPATDIQVREQHRIPQGKRG